MPVHRTAIRPVARGAALIALTLSAPAQPARGALHGTYAPDCAPNDAPAFLIVLPADARNTEIWLKANAPPDRIAGHWPQAAEAGLEPGAASILLCRTRPALRCDRALSGSFTVDRGAGGSITGRLAAHFAGNPPLAVRFHATPARLTAPVVCG